MRKMIKWVVAGSSVLGAGAMMTVGAGAVSGHDPVTVSQVAAAHTTGDISGADQAAVTYVDTNYPGSGVATVQTTIANTEAGVLVYDVTIMAPDGSTYVVHVQQSNDAVLSANLADNLVTTPTVTATATVDPTETDATDSTTTDSTEATSTEAVETESNAGTSTDNQSSDTSSSDNQSGSTSSDETSTSTTLDATATLGQSTGVQGSDGAQGASTSGDGSSDGLGISTQILSGSFDTGSGSTTNSDN